MRPLATRSPAALRSAGYFGRAAVLVVVDGLALWALAAVLPGMEVPSLRAGIATAAAIALLNALAWPLLTRLLLPLTVLTFGLLSLVLNAAVVGVAVRAIDGSDPTFAATLLAALGLAVVTMLVEPLLDFDGDAYHLRVVRRRVRGARRRNETDVPGVIMFEIDGLAEQVLREAVELGRVPTIARWLAQGSHRIVGWECDLSSQTAASQAGLLHGSNDEMPAFRWYEKDGDRLLVANHPRDAAEIERRHSDGGGLLAAGGASRGNMLSGDAPRCSATMSAIRDRGRSRSSEFFAYFADPYGLLRTLALSVADVAVERRAARRQRRSGAPHVDRGGTYPAARAAIVVVMRDLNVATLMADVVEGVPVAYSTFVGYDEVAHHSGIREPDAFDVLERLDAQLARLERTALHQAPRPYHLVVLSDHGQTQGAPFRQLHGETLEDVVRRLVADGAVHAPPAVDEAWGELGALLADAREDDSAAGRMLRRATSDRVADGAVALGPNREALREQAELNARADGSADGARDAIVLASGCLGLVYFPGEPGRLSAEEIERRHPGLLAGLVGHPGIGFALVRSEHEGAVALGAAGRVRLSDGAVEGEDPLAPYGDNALRHLRRHDGFRTCPDILVNGAYDPATGEVQPFEEFMGSHGGLGGTQMHPFAVVPAEWSEPPEPIVGAEAMHRQLVAWLAETGLDGARVRAVERLAESGPARRAVAAAERLRAVPAVRTGELTVRRFVADGMVDRGASLAYYGLLSLLPTLMIVAGVVSLVGGESTPAEFQDYLRDAGASRSLADTAEAVVAAAVDSAPTQASAVGLVGLATLLYGASRAFAAAGRALDAIWRRTPASGAFVRRRAVGIGWTLGLIALALLAGLLTFVGRGLAEDLLALVGLSAAVGPLWTIVRWPLAAVAVMLAMRIVMWAAPSPPRGRFTLVTPGSALAAAGWLGGSAAYGLYVGELASYNVTYGAFAALVILLLWIWLTAMAFLLGCEFDAVLAERRAQRVSAAAAVEPPRPAGGPGPPSPAPAEPRGGRTRAEDR